MTFRSRLMFGLVTAALLFAMVPSSFAQISLQVITDPSAGEIQTNRNAQTASPGVSGDGILISGSLVANSPLTATVLLITFPSPITSSPVNCVSYPSNVRTVAACPAATSTSQNVPSADAIRIEGATGIFTNVSLPALNTGSSRIEIVLPSGSQTNFSSTVSDPTVNSSNGSFRLVGTRIDANGKTGAQSIAVSLNSAANNYILTTTSGTVISSIANGIGAVAIGARSTNTNQGTATIFTNRTVPDASGSLTFAEGFAAAFRTATQSSNSGSAVTNGTGIRLTFNNVPTGVTLTLTNTGGSPSGSGYTLSNTSVTATTNTSNITFTNTNLTSTETFELDYTVAASSTAAVTTAGTVTVTATLFPIGDGVDNTVSSALNAPRGDQGYPAFAQLDVGPLTVVNIVSANTTMLLPYAFSSAPFDTGLAIANTTADPFGGAAGGGAVASAGTVTLTFYPTASAGGAGTSFSLTTSATVRPGSGLSADGTLAAGATWSVLLSQLLAAAGQTGSFSGYIFIQTNFLNGHGTATISDFRTYSLASNVLVLPPPATASRSTPAGSAEQLNN